MKKIIKLDTLIKAYRTMNREAAHLKHIKTHMSTWADWIANAEASLSAAMDAFEAEAAPINAIIKSAEGRATARTITAETIAEMLADYTDKLSISKKAMEGIVLVCDHHAQTFPAAYKYRPESTWFGASYKGGWRLDFVERRYTRTTATSVTLTDAAKAAIIKNFEKF